MSCARKKLLAAVVALALCLGLVPAIAFAGSDSDEPINYVALADSMGQGYMFLDYNENAAEGHYCGWKGSSANGYIRQFAAEMEKDAGAPVELNDLSIQGLQPDEMCAFLEGYSIDQINGMTQGAKKHIGWWVGDYATDEEQDPSKYIFPTFQEMSQYFTDAIKNADVITYDIGMNYFGTYLSDARGSNEVVSELVSDPSLKSAVESFRSILKSLLESQGMSAAQARIDGIMYAYASYLKYTEQCLGDIYALNPDVEVILVPLANPHRELYVDVEGYQVSYTTIIDLMMESLNDYMKYYSDYRKDFTIANLKGDVTSFADELYFYPDSLSADAKALLQKTVLGYNGILGYEDKAVPQAVADNFSYWAAILAGAGFNQEMIMGMFNGIIDYLADDGTPMVQGLVFDNLVWDYIAEKYGEQIAFDTFYGNNYVAWMDGTFYQMQGMGEAPSLDPCVMADTMEYKQNPFYCSVTIHDYNVDRARAAIAAGNAAPWQEYLIEAIDGLLVNWEGLCLKAATYRTFPMELLTGGATPDITIDRVVELLANPDSATDDELLMLHAAIRNGEAARGFGAHPCPRGLEVKHAAVLDAYGKIRSDINGVKNAVTVHYVNADGSQAAADAVAKIAIGAEYFVESPTIEGFVPTTSAVAGTMGKKNIEATVTYQPLAAEGCATQEAAQLAAGALHLCLNGKDMGEFVFAEGGASWTIKNVEGKYLVVENGKLAYKDSATMAWDFGSKGFSTKVTTTSKSSGSGILGFISSLLGGKSSSRTTTTTYYLSAGNKGLTVATSAGKSTAATFFAEKDNGAHVAAEPQIVDVVAPTCCEFGSHVEVYCCTVCGEEIARCSVVDAKAEHVAAAPVRENVEQPSCDVPGTYDEVVYCSTCGEEISRTPKVIEATAHTAAAPVLETIEGVPYHVTYCSKCHALMGKEEVSGEVLVNVTVTSKTTGFWIFSETTYSVAIDTVSTIPGVSVQKVQYSTNNRTWKTGTNYSTSSNPRTLYVKVTCSDGSVHNFVYANGKTTAK